MTAELTMLSSIFPKTEECLLTGMLQISGKKVLHLNRWKKAVPFWKKWKLPSPEPHIQSAPLDRRERDGKVDLNPKLLIVNSQLVRLIDPDDRRNLFPRSLHFKSFEGSYEYEGGHIHKVYPYDKDNLIDSLGDFYRSENYRWIESVVDDERRDFEDFLKYIQEWQEDDPNTWNDIDPDSTTMYQVYGYFDLNPGFADYTGRALALYRDDTYLNRPARETFRRIKIYSKSLACYDEPGSLWLFMASTDYEGYRSVFEGVEEDRQSFLPGAASEFRVFEDIPHLVQGFAGIKRLGKETLKYLKPETHQN
ncbi:hypothetical protein QYM36_019050 [Artemia franciscana]|uniref:Rab GDP dissociation inhibitor n=1 Tax=Artemia franciscana TaxID=6661 RepID=A0AA88H1M8_ARTSF|nr:hypothetical protein QYM36_019050 [Artemia franciscana]